MRNSHYERPYRTSRCTLSDGRTAVVIPRERKHFSPLRNGYPLEEAFVDDLRTQGVDAIIIQDGDDRYLFDVSQYLRGDRIGHDPYPMLRVASLDDAAPATGAYELETQGAASERLTDPPSRS